MTPMHSKMAGIKVFASGNEVVALGSLCKAIMLYLLIHQPNYSKYMYSNVCFSIAKLFIFLLLFVLSVMFSHYTSF